jgi:hypothetical protein
VTVPAVPSAVKFVNTYTYYGRQWVTIHHCLKGDNLPWTIADCDTAADAFQTASINLMNVLSPSNFLTSTECQDLSADNSFAVIEPSSPIHGGATGDPGLPIQVCIVGSWTLGVKYRGGKPRTYLSGIPTAVTSDMRTILPAHATDFENAFGAFQAAVNAIADPNSGDITLACVAYSRGKVPLVTPIVNPIVSVAVHERLDSQRRRTGKESSYPVVFP